MKKGNRDPVRMKKAVASLEEYILTYKDQECYESYSDETFIDDILYGLGIALDPMGHRFADGYQRFKEKLLSHIQPKGQDGK